MSNNIISALEEQFNKDYKVINIRYEYEGLCTLTEVLRKYQSVTVSQQKKDEKSRSAS